MVLNATPHSSLVVSPFFKMFGMQLPLPGWQSLGPYPDEQVRAANIYLQRQQDMMRCVLMSDKNLSLEGSSRFSIGDVVVYHQSDYEMGAHRRVAGLTYRESYDTRWSLPCEVVRVKDKALEVKLLCGDQDKEKIRQVPVVRCRKIGPARIPESLLNMTSLSLTTACNRQRPRSGS
eukprot:GHVS01016129.1.p1 GENE.GHVS01016129.1~~GHVS01016129.1.p1  ORF type:complete len:176 (+),score=10.23 GHVS01016129.1:557-1084(+)